MTRAEIERDLVRLRDLAAHHEAEANACEVERDYLHRTLDAGVVEDVSDEG